MTRCTGVSVVKNEADVIEVMVRHNLQYIDAITFFDNGSTDGTLEILQALRSEGLPVTIIEDKRAGHPQTEIINDFVASPQCDRSGYVFFLDGDEFISSDPAEFATFIAAGPPSFSIQWKTYVPTVRNAKKDANVISRITHCRRREPLRGKCMKAVLSPLDTGQVRIADGCHSIAGLDLKHSAAMRLAHYPIRSAEQLACKALLGAWNVQLRGRKGAEAFQWFEIAEQIRRSGLPSPAELQQIGAAYAIKKTPGLLREPLTSPQPVDLRYTHMALNPLLNGLIRFTDTLVAKLAEA